MSTPEAVEAVEEDLIRPTVPASVLRQVQAAVAIMEAEEDVAAAQ